MNTKKTSNFRGLGAYLTIIVIVVLIWAWLGNNTTSNSYTKNDFEKALAENQVVNVEVIQNREIPTGSLEITLSNETKQKLYVSDVNEIQALMDENNFTNYSCDDVPAENWIMTLLPYLLVFGAVFILFMIANNNASSQSGGGRMMNFGKNRAKLTTEDENTTKFDNVAGLR